MNSGDFLIFAFFVLAVLLICLNVYYSYRAYLNSIKYPYTGPHTIHNHIHVMGGKSNAIIDRSVRSYDQHDDVTNHSTNYFHNDEDKAYHFDEPEEKTKSSETRDLVVDVMEADDHSDYTANEDDK